MIGDRRIYGRWVFNIADMEAERERKRKKKLAYYKRMKAMGIRGTSIQKYLRRGFPGAFVEMLHLEMAQLIQDIKRMGLR